MVQRVFPHGTIYVVKVTKKLWWGWGAESIQSLSEKRDKDMRKRTAFAMQTIL